MTAHAVDPKILARAKLAERRRHIRKLRRTVVAIAVALFVALWGVIFVRLVTGHDPVVSASSASGAVSGGSTGTSTATGSSPTGSSTAGSGTSSSGTTSVTTRSS